ncbi:hypothetical protein EsH8_IX_000219 [Colletotrichum jinshuiense]
MFKNGMRESKEGVVELDDIEPQIFTSFIEYALYGNYEMPNPQSSKKETTTQDRPMLIPIVELSEEDYASLSEHLFSQDSLLRRRQPYLKYMDLFVGQGADGMLYGLPKRLPGTEKEDLEKDSDLLMENRQFGEICMHHVKVYMFADRYNISKLRQLCLNRLHGCLVRAKLSDSGYHLLFNVIEFAFANTIPGDKLRKLLVQNCVADLSLIRNMPGFRRLLIQVPEIGFEIISELPKYWESRDKALIDIDAKFKENELTNIVTKRRHPTDSAGLLFDREVCDLTHESGINSWKPL